MYTEIIDDLLYAVYLDGESCNHIGCLHHISHPCEKCGRIAGKGIVYLLWTFYE
jgi:hypothetical protein